MFWAIIMYQGLTTFLFSPFCFAFIISLFAVFILERFARRVNFFDRPDGKLKVQKIPVACLGGAAILLVLVVMSGLINGCSSFAWLGADEQSKLPSFLFAIVPFFLIGFFDDVFVFSPRLKFALQVIAAIFFLHLLGGLLFSFFKIFFWLFFILTVVNAFNLADVSDGLLGGICLPIFGFFWVYGIVFNFLIFSFLSQILLGAILGFLVFNWAPARMYLGDAGSLLLASAALYFVFVSFLLPGTLVRFALAIFLLGVPLAELAGLITIRTFLGLPIYMGSPHHFSIYLKQQGLSSRHVAMLAGSASTFLALVTASVLYLAVPLLLAVIFLGALFGWWCYFIYHPQKPLAKVFAFFQNSSFWTHNSKKMQ